MRFENRCTSSNNDIHMTVMLTKLLAAWVDIFVEIITFVNGRHHEQLPTWHTHADFVGHLIKVGFLQRARIGNIFDLVQVGARLTLYHHFFPLKIKILATGETSVENQTLKAGSWIWKTLLDPFFHYISIATYKYESPMQIIKYVGDDPGKIKPTEYQEFV